MTLTFSPATSQMNYTLSLVDDMVLEDMETFTVSLSLVSESAGVQLGTDSVATATILDDDEVTVQFEVVTCALSVGESVGSLEVSMTRTGFSAIPVTVLVQSEDGSATGEQ